MVAKIIDKTIAEETVCIVFHHFEQSNFSFEEKFDRNYRWFEKAQHGFFFKHIMEQDFGNSQWKQ